MLEKERMLILAFLVFSLFVGVAILDGWFTVLAVQPYEWANLHYWILVMLLLLSVSSFLIGLASLLGDNSMWSLEDFSVVILLTVQPWILLWCGLLDGISRTVQGYLWNEPFMSWLTQDFAWTWIDPSATLGIPMLPYLVSRLLGFVGTVSVGVALGSIISIFIVAGLWAPYLTYVLICIEMGVEVIYLLAQGRKIKPARRLANNIARKFNMKIVNNYEYKDTKDDVTLEALCIELRKARTHLKTRRNTKPRDLQL